MRRSVAIALLSSALLALAGCKGSCRELSEKLCDCGQSPAERDACIQQVIAEQGRLSPTAEQEALCEQQLEVCNCQLIDTEEGKRACGLAR